MERHYTTPEELLERNAQEQKRTTGFDYERHYTSPEELLERNAQEQKRTTGFDYERHYTSPEEYFGGASDLTTRANERMAEEIRRAQDRKEIAEKMQAERIAREEWERFERMPVGQRLYELVSFYGRALGRNQNNPSDVELSKKVFSALKDFRNKDLTSLHTLFGELETGADPFVIDVLPQWNELLQQCEQAIGAKKEEQQSFKQTKDEYKKVGFFSRVVSKLRDEKTNSIDGGKKK